MKQQEQKQIVARLLKRMPRYMHPDFSLIETLDDLLFQCSHEVDLAEEDNVEPRWTKGQLHRAKMFTADVHIALQDFSRDHPEQVDPMNHTEDPAAIADFEAAERYRSLAERNPSLRRDYLKRAHQAELVGRKRLAGVL